MQKRTDEIDRAPVQRHGLRLLQRPAKFRGGQAEGRRERQDPHFSGIDAPCKGRTHAEEERIAGRQHHDGRPPQGKDRIDRALEGACPDMRFAGDERTCQFQMPGAAKDHLRRCDAALGLVAETG